MENVRIKFTLKGQEIEITPEEARELMLNLQNLLGEKPPMYLPPTVDGTPRPLTPPLGTWGLNGLSKTYAR